MTLPASAASDLLTATAIKEPRLLDRLQRIALERGAAPPIAVPGRGRLGSGGKAPLASNPDSESPLTTSG